MNNFTELTIDYEKVTIDDKDFLKLQQLYKNAVKEDQEIFIFKGREVLTAYAKYLIEYLLETHFKK